VCATFSPRKPSVKCFSLPLRVSPRNSLDVVRAAVVVLDDPAELLLRALLHASRDVDHHLLDVELERRLELLHHRDRVAGALDVGGIELDPLLVLDLPLQRPVARVVELEPVRGMMVGAAHVGRRLTEQVTAERTAEENETEA
jgi:hypothetical protein